jgi:hypothetical protein
MMPLTLQEEIVKRLLTEQRLAFEAPHVFDLNEKGRISVDFLIFHDAGLVLECTICSTRKGRALSELRRRSAYIDYRFGLLKSSFPKLTCGALVEAPNEDQERLASQHKPILRNSDFVAKSDEEVRSELTRFRGGLR